MEVLAPVALNIDQIKKVVDETDGCIAWGGRLNLAAADDKLIRIRNPLHLDPDPLLLSSIIAKKRAEGASYVLIDIPYGRGAKIDNLERAENLAEQFRVTGFHLGMRIDTAITDGTEPTVRTIGPAQEAKMVLETLDGEGSSVLLQKSCRLAGLMISQIKNVSPEEGFKIALRQVKSKAALKKLREIIEAQGGNPKVKSKDISVGEYSHTVKSEDEGEVNHLDNKDISQIVRYLGAPTDKKGGVVLHARKHERVKKGSPLYTLYSSDKSKLSFALEQLKHYPIVTLEKVVIDFQKGQAPSKGKK
jgi:AMP phosphorylase